MYFMDNRMWSPLLCTTRGRPIFFPQLYFLPFCETLGSFWSSTLWRWDEWSPAKPSKRDSRLFRWTDLRTSSGWRRSSRGRGRKEDTFRRLRIRIFQGQWSGCNASHPAMGLISDLKLYWTRMRTHVLWFEPLPRHKCRGGSFVNRKLIQRWGKMWLTSRR